MESLLDNIDSGDIKHLKCTHRVCVNRGAEKCCCKHWVELQRLLGDDANFGKIIDTWCDLLQIALSGIRSQYWVLISERSDFIGCWLHVFIYIENESQVDSAVERLSCSVPWWDDVNEDLLKSMLYYDEKLSFLRSFNVSRPHCWVDFYNWIYSCMYSCDNSILENHLFLEKLEDFLSRDDGELYSLVKSSLNPIPLSF